MQSCVSSDGFSLDLEKGFFSDPRSSRDGEGCLTTGLVTSGCDTGRSWPSTLCGDLVVFHLSCAHERNRD